MVDDGQASAARHSLQTANPSEIPYSRFTKKLVRQTCGGHAWIVDRRFDLANHVFAAPPSAAQSSLDVRRYVETMSGRRLVWDRPLWEIHVLALTPEDVTLALLRIHPCLADGTTLMRLLCRRLADTNVNAPAYQRTAARAHYGRLAYTFNVVRCLFVGKTTYSFNSSSFKSNSTVYNSNLFRRLLYKTLMQFRRNFFHFFRTKTKTERN